MKVLITQDFLTTSAGLGYFQLKSLSSIAKVLKAIPGLVVDSRTISRSLFLGQLGIADDEQKYIFKVNESHLKDLQSLIKETFKDYDLVVGYELTEITRIALTNNNVHYLDLWVSPIRFYRDIFFELHSNCARINEVLKENRIEELLLHKRAQEIKNYSDSFLPQPLIKKNSLLIIFQLAEDKSVVKDGDFLTLKGFSDDLKKLAESYEHTYLLRHPKQSPSDFDSICESFREMPRQSIINDASIYSLLSSDHLKDIVAISSSVLSECNYFHKRPIYLYRPVIPTYYNRIYEPIYSCDFWKRVLNLSTEYRSPSLIIQDNDFRVSKNAVYGFKQFLNYNPLDLFSFSHHKSLVQLLSFVDEVNRSGCAVAIYGYGTLGKIIAPLFERVSAIFDENPQETSFGPEVKVLTPSQMNLKGFRDALFVVTPYHSFDEIKANKLRGFQSVNLGLILGTVEE
jgi:hypothetical protein